VGDAEQMAATAVMVGPLAAVSQPVVIVSALAVVTTELSAADARWRS
jgi:hypothetical protein